MAVCPECSGEMGMLDAVCRNCGNSFAPSTESALDSRGLIWSNLADYVLMGGALVSGLSCVGFATHALQSLYQGELLVAFMSGPVAIMASSAMVVVFARSASMSGNES